MARSSFLSVLGSTTFKAAPDKPIRSNFPASTRFNEPFISNSANLMLDEPLLIVRTKLTRRYSQYPPNSAGTVVPLASQASTIRLDKTVRAPGRAAQPPVQRCAIGAPAAQGARHPIASSRKRPYAKIRVFPDSQFLLFRAYCVCHRIRCAKDQTSDLQETLLVQLFFLSSDARAVAAGDAQALAFLPSRGRRHLRNTGLPVPL